MKKKPRLLGVDLVRGISAYAVVFVHSGDETLGLPISQDAVTLRLYFYFAVPFFLATAFYFLISKPEIDISWKFWRSRFDRIVIPYVTWSSIYIVFRSLFFWKSQELGRLEEFLKDPLAIGLLGGASYHLYFLPLLFTGTFLVAIAKYLQKTHISRPIVGCFAIFSIITYEWLLRSGNSFHLAPNTAFLSLSQTMGWETSQLPLLRLILVQIAWLVRCLPYLLVSVLLIPLINKINNWNSTYSGSQSSYLQEDILQSNSSDNSPAWKISYRLVVAILCGVIFMMSNSPISIGVFDSLREILQASSLLLLSVIWSGYIQNNRPIQNVGACSFGIYLIHPFAMVGVKLFLARFLPGLANEVSIISMMTISIASFAISWIAIASMTKYKWISKYTLGV
jgi:surface polysaccharide O-acyltransferase-like enzyme